MTKVKKDVIMDYSKFKINVERWSPERFMKLPAYYRNRYVEKRVSKMVARLGNGPLPTQLIVAVGRVTKDFGEYKKGQYFRLDGHTRTDVWKVREDLIPNVDLIVIVYDVNMEDYAWDIYKDIDSQESVETSSDKVTGLLRERKYNPRSKRIKEGKFKTAVVNACRHLHTPEGVYLNDKSYNNKFHIKLDYFWNELLTIDNIGIDSMERYSGNVLTAFLMVCKKYGVKKSERYKEMVENYREGTSEYTFNEVDGIHYVYNILYPKQKDNWTQTGYSNSEILISKILYCFDKFMKGETITKKGKLPSDDKLVDFYKTYLN